MKLQETHNNRIVLYIILLISVIAIMISLKRCETSPIAGLTERHSEGDTIDVAIEYSPLFLYTYNDTLGGFNYDLLRIIARQNHINLKFHPIVKLNDALQGIDKGLYDIVAASLPMTADNKEKYRFSEPVYLDKQVLVQLKDSLTGKCRINSQLDLAGDTVWVVEGSPVAKRVSNLAREIGDTIYTRFEPTYGTEQLFLLTATGEIKQAVINERIAKQMVVHYPNMDISTDISFNQFQSWIISKDKPALADSMDVWIKRAKATQSYRDLEMRYLK